MMRTKTSTIDVTTATPMRCMRAFCLDCTGGSKADVRDCSYTDCPLFPYRMGKRPPRGTAARPLKTIRKQCIECMNGQVSLIRDCPAAECALHRYRMGRKVPQAYRLEAVNAFSDAPVMNHTPKELEAEKQPLFAGVL